MAYEREKMPSVLSAGAAAAPIRELCASATKSVPASAASIRGMKYQSAPGDWTVDAPDGGFACLRFMMDMPQYYQYSYARSGKGSAPGDSFTGTANGDLNGDGVLSTFQIRGAIAAGGTLNVAPTLIETNPDE
jgi:type IV pilus assembly protein PilA